MSDITRDQFSEIYFGDCDLTQDDIESKMVRRNDGSFEDDDTEVAYLNFRNGARWQSARAGEGEPECPYSCGWRALRSIIVKNAALFARDTADGIIPEDLRQSGIASGQYAISLLDWARKLNHPPAKVPEGWKLVPEDPTGLMLNEIALTDDFTFRALTTRYKAMLAKAPNPPKGDSQ